MNIVIGDAHPIVAGALCGLLETAIPGARVEAISLQGALLAKLRSNTVDLLVVELHWPGPPQGLRLLESIMGLIRGAGIVVHTGNEHSAMALAALDLGVAGYVLKSSGPLRAVQAVTTVVSGGRYIDPAVDLAAARDHPWHRLTAAERNVMIQLGRGGSLTGLAMQRDRSYKTVSTQKYSALRKLELRGHADIRQYLMDQGLNYLIE